MFYTTRRTLMYRMIKQYEANILFIAFTIQRQPIILIIVTFLMQNCRSFKGKTKFLDLYVGKCAKNKPQNTLNNKMQLRLKLLLFIKLSKRDLNVGVELPFITVLTTIRNLYSGHPVHINSLQTLFFTRLSFYFRKFYIGCMYLYHKTLINYLGQNKLIKQFFNPAIWLLIKVRDKTWFTKIFY